MKLQRHSLSSSYICPITNRTMQIAVMASDNHYYDEFAIKRWLFLNLNSPCTHQAFSTKKLVCNRKFEKELDLYVKKNEIKFSTTTYQDFFEINPNVNLRERYHIKKHNYHILQNWIYDEKTTGKSNVKVMQTEISVQLIRVLLRWRKELEFLAHKLGTIFNLDDSTNNMGFYPQPSLSSDLISSTLLSKKEDMQLQEIERIAQTSANFQCTVVSHYLGEKWPLAMTNKEVNKSLIDFEETFNKSLVNFLVGLAEPLQLLTKYYVLEMPEIKKRNIELLEKINSGNLFELNTDSKSLYIRKPRKEEKSIALLEKNNLDKEIVEYIKNH